MSKTDQMRALREARFTRSSAAAPRRVAPSPIAAPPPRAARPVPPVATPEPVAEPAPAGPVPVEAVPVAAVPVAAVPVEAVAAAASEAADDETSVVALAGEQPVVNAPSFEVPTLDIPLPAAVPRLREPRDAPSPLANARHGGVAQAPAPEQIVIPALEVDGGSVVAAAAEVAGAPEAVVPIGHGVTPGQPIAAYSREELVAVVRWVARDAKARDAAAMVRDVMVELAFKRKGAKITAAITDAAASIGALSEDQVPGAAPLGAIAS